MNRLMPTLVAGFAVFLVSVSGAGATQPPARYPLDLATAVAKAYTGTFTGVQRSCTVWLNGGRDEYGIAEVSLRGGRTDLAGFQFINTAGWFNMWRQHKPTASVPAGQRSTVTRLVAQLAAKCATRWTP